MRILLLQLDGKLPNITLMRIAAHHRDRGDQIDFRYGCPSPQASLFDPAWDTVYASAIFDRTKPAVLRVLSYWPQAIVGGTGWGPHVSLEAHGITTLRQDYSIYPTFQVPWVSLYAARAA